MARFLKDKDYKKQVRDWIRNILVYNDADVQADCELAAQCEMETYLSNRYDIASIFSTVQAESDRNPLIILYLIDITLYHLHSNISPDNVPELRLTRYKAAIDWLKAVAMEKISPILPPKINESGTQDISFVYGSNPKTSNTRY